MSELKAVSTFLPVFALVSMKIEQSYFSANSLPYRVLIWILPFLSILFPIKTIIVSIPELSRIYSIYSGRISKDSFEQTS